jgi:hypothetical protein
MLRALSLAPDFNVHVQPETYGAYVSEVGPNTGLPTLCVKKEVCDEAPGHDRHFMIEMAEKVDLPPVNEGEEPRHRERWKATNWPCGDFVVPCEARIAMPDDIS